MPPPLAVIWRTWPQILLPFSIWAVLSWLQGGFSFRLIPPSSPVACQSQTDSLSLQNFLLLTMVHTDSCISICLFIMCNLVSRMLSLSHHCGHAHLTVSPPWLRAPRCHLIIVMPTWVPHYRGYAHFVVTSSLLCALSCLITAVICTLLSHYYWRTHYIHS